MFLSATGKVLQVPDGSSTPGIKLKGNKRTENMNQIWEIEESKNGGYCIKSFSGSYLDAEGEKRSSGTSIIQWPKNGKKNQTWHIRPLKIEKKFSTDKLYEIVSALDKNMNLTVFRPDNPNSPDNKNLIIYQKNNKNNQKFKIVEHDDGSC